MRKGRFQERLFKAVQGEDELIIRRCDDESQEYHLRLTSETANYGRLAANVFVDAAKATPGRIIAAIEKANVKIETTVQMMLDAKGDDSE